MRLIGLKLAMWTASSFFESKAAIFVLIAPKAASNNAMDLREDLHDVILDYFLVGYEEDAFVVVLARRLLHR